MGKDSRTSPIAVAPGPGWDMAAVARAIGWTGGPLPVYRTDGDDQYVLALTHPRFGPYHLRFRRGELAEVIGQPGQGHPITCMTRGIATRLEFECPLYWDNLTPTGDETVRHCGRCDRPVYFCETEREAAERAANRECIAFRTPVRVLLGIPKV